MTTGRTPYPHYLVGHGEETPAQETSARPADTIANLADYLWWLLPGFLKRKARHESLVGAFCEAFGESLDLARETLRETPPQLLIQTASGEYLTHHGRMRQTPRRRNEDDGDYRPRVLNAWQLKQRQGSIPGLIETLAGVGVTARIWEYRVLSRSLFEPPVDPPPAERDAYLIPGPVELTWDDWEPGAPPLPLDEGVLDDYAEPTGAWAGHANQLAMWEAGAWVYLDPIDGMVVKVQDENEPYGRLYCYSAEDGAWGAWTGVSQWAHFVVQVLDWDDDYNQVEFDRVLRATRPAHTRAIIVDDLANATWDDWTPGARPNRLDEGVLDDWLPTGPIS